MERVKLPREIAEALDDVKEHFGRWEWHAMLCIFDQGAIERPSAAALRDYASFHNNIKIILQALVNGYEVEQTPEDKVRDKFNNPNAWNPNAYRFGIKDTLDALNIKISGVNTE